MTIKNTITVSENDLLASIDDNDTISLSDWDSPLSTSLNTSMYPAATLGTVGSSGMVGATLSTTTGGSLSWNNPSYTVTATASPYTNATIGWNTYTQPATQGSLKVEGNAEFNGDIKIKGVSLDERFSAIEERLAILRPNNDLEGRWEKLKKLGEEYRKLEKEILEGEAIWDTLKK